MLNVSGSFTVFTWNEHATVVGISGLFTELNLDKHATIAKIIHTIYPKYNMLYTVMYQGHLHNLPQIYNKLR